MIHEAHSKQRDISFLWISRHEGIKGNEKADQFARLDCHLELSQIQLDSRNFFNTFKKQMFLEWQSCWKESAKMKAKTLFAILPTVNVSWHFPIRF
ncbi:hypothetical protein Trydic_g2920 [Trypoxylus dichotomus]